MSYSSTTVGAHLERERAVVLTRGISGKWPLRDVDDAELGHRLAQSQLVPVWIHETHLAGDGGGRASMVELWGGDCGGADCGCMDESLTSV